MYDTRHPIFFYLYTALLIIRLIVCTLALASDIYLIVVISKFKSLKTRINCFIRQYAIFHMLYLVLANLSFVTHNTQYYHYMSGSYCILSNLDQLMVTLGYYALTFMAFEWYVQNYRSRIYDRYPKSFKYGVYILYLFALSKGLITTTVCFIDPWPQYIRFSFEMASFWFCVITVIGITIFTKQKTLPTEDNKTEYALIIARTVLLLSLGWCITYIVYFIFHGVEPIFFETLFDVPYLVAVCLVFASPIIVLYQLRKSNKSFKRACITSCKKNGARYSDEENLDTEAVADIPATIVTFNNKPE